MVMNKSLAGAMVALGLMIGFAGLYPRPVPTGTGHRPGACSTTARSGRPTKS